MRVHRKVWIWWGRWWAVQIMLNRYFSVGIHLDFSRGYVDIYFAWLTVSVGNNPIITDHAERHLNRCRGFVISDAPIL